MLLFVESESSSEEETFDEDYSEDDEDYNADSVEDSDEDSDEDFDEDDENYVPIKLDEGVCPEGCDPQIYENTIHFRDMK